MVINLSDPFGLVPSILIIVGSILSWRAICLCFKLFSSVPRCRSFIVCGLYEIFDFVHLFVDKHFSQFELANAYLLLSSSFDTRHHDKMLILVSRFKVPSEELAVQFCVHPSSTLSNLHHSRHMSWHQCKKAWLMPYRIWRCLRFILIVDESFLISHKDCFPQHIILIPTQL